MREISTKTPPYHPAAPSANVICVPSVRTIIYSPAERTLELASSHLATAYRTLQIGMEYCKPGRRSENRNGDREEISGLVLDSTNRLPLGAHPSWTLKYPCRTRFRGNRSEVLHEVAAMIEGDRHRHRHRRLANSSMPSPVTLEMNCQRRQRSLF